MYYRKSFFNQNQLILSTSLKSQHFPNLVNQKKAIWRNLLSIQNEAISLVAMQSKELWLVQEKHATVKLDSSIASCGMKTQTESRIKMQNLSKSWWKYWKVSFVICLVLWTGIELRKLAEVVSTGGHLIWILNERSMWLVILKSVWCSASLYM